MKILYVTPVWSGFRDVLFEGSAPKGMPAFMKPLQALVARGHTVDFLIATAEEPQVKSTLPWLTPERLTFVRWDTATLGATLRSCRKLYTEAMRMTGAGGYDFVYGHGSVGALGTLAAQRRGIPAGQRLYGTFLVQETVGAPTPLRKLALFRRHPLEYLAFSQPKRFLLTTNDGTRGDEVHRWIGSTQFEWLFWLNGVDFPAETVDVTLPDWFQPDRPFLLYPARLATWKRQDWAVELLHRLENPAVRLYLLGHANDAEYRERLEALIDLTGFLTIGSFQSHHDRSQWQWLYIRHLHDLSGSRAGPRLRY